MPTAEIANVSAKSEVESQHLIVELVILTVLTVALVVSLVLLRKRGMGGIANRAT